MIGKLSRLIIAASLAVLVCLPAQAQESGNTQSASWGHIKSLYRSDDVAKSTPPGITDETIQKLQQAQTEEEVQQILDSAPASVRERLMSESTTMVSSEPAPPAWTHPVASEAMRKFGLSSSDILAVQRVLAIDNGIPIDSADVVVTEKQWYYSSLTTGELTDTPGGGFAFTHEMDIYGSGVEITAYASDCWRIHYAVTFHMPVCFYELTPGSGVFDGVIDAWAPNPACSWWCNGGLCALYQCGSAWNGSGREEWWKFQPFCSDPRASRKIGKVVQKRWLHTWQLCYGRSDPQIAQSVRARIRY